MVQESDHDVVSVQLISIEEDQEVASEIVQSLIVGEPSYFGRSQVGQNREQLFLGKALVGSEGSFHIETNQVVLVVNQGELLDLRQLQMRINQL